MLMLQAGGGVGGHSWDTNLSHSLFCPPDATTVLMAPKTSWAIAPALAQAFNSEADANATSWRGGGGGGTQLRH